jgi:hypothetical protein
MNDWYDPEDEATMKKFNKKQAREYARKMLLDLIDREIRSPSDLMQWEDLPDMSEWSFDKSYEAVYEELRLIHQQLAKRWHVDE